MTDTMYLDIRGQICPSCLLLVLKALNLHASAIQAGQLVIEVVTDDRQATSTIPATADRMGFRTVTTRLDDGYQIRITAGE